MQFIPMTFEQAEKEYPGAYMIAEVEGGVMIFAFASDYETWQNQQ
jgi:hypothetical protein